jgi:hypothetical protein
MWYKDSSNNISDTIGVLLRDPDKSIYKELRKVSIRRKRLFLKLSPRILETIPNGGMEVRH